MSVSKAVIPEFRMSAFVALSGLRRYLRDHPATPIHEAANSLKRSDADFAAADFEGALRLHAQLPSAIDFIDAAASVREGLSVLVETYRPWWLALFPHGRHRVATALTRDELQTFRAAGLFEEQPGAGVVEWWDRFAAVMRSATDDRLNMQGRYAEKLSIAYELKRLATYGITERPRWVALDDNSAGYDIQSYENTDYGVKNLLIEVKSSQRSPPRMILTRGEWDAAVKYGETYVFHLWKLPVEELLVMSVADVAQHIPRDLGCGKWTEIEIQL